MPMLLDLRPFILSLCLTVCLTGQASADTKLYDRLGGGLIITRVADVSVTRFLADPRIAADFDNINPDRLRKRLADFICVIADGPCTYKGHSMAASHKGLHINQAHFNAVVEDFQDAMDQAGIGFRTQNMLLARLAPMQRDIVTR